MEPFVPSRRSVIRTAAWSVPVVAVATTAPAFAASPEPPNLETTVIPTPTRNGDTLAFAPFDIVNTGGTSTQGINLTFSNPTGTIENIRGSVFGQTVDLNGFSGATVTGLGTSTATATLPADFFGRNSDPDAPMDTFVTILVVTDDAEPTTLQVTISAVNGGDPAGATFTDV